MSGLWKELRPYLALWPAIARLAVGTWRMLGTVTSKCLAGEGSDKAWRALGAVAAAEFGRRCAQQAPLLMVPLTLAWLVLAWRCGKPAPAEPDDQEQEGEAADPAAEEDDQEPEEPPLPDREQLTAALHHVGAPHAHLSALAAHLQETPARTRAALEEAGIPTAGGVRAGGRVSTGVKQQDFPPLPAAPSDPDDGVVVAGQRTTTTATGPVVERPSPGMVIIRDAADTAQRHHTLRRT